MNVVKSIIFVCFVMPVFFLLALLIWGWEKCFRRKRRRHAVKVFILIDGERVCEMFKMEKGDKVKGEIEVLDKNGDPAPIDGKPQWNNADAEAFSMAVSEDGKSVEIECLKQGAASLLSVDVDADLGDGVRNLHAEELLVSDVLEAVSIGLKFGEIQKPV